MRHLDELVDAWLDEVSEAEAHLRPHLEEIGDHVRTDARARVASGSDAPTAVAAAIAALGATHDIAHDYAITEQGLERRLAGRFAVVTVVGTLVVTGIVVAIDKLIQPIDPRWFAFTYLPVLVVSNLIFVGRFMRRARARSRSARAR